MNNDVIEFARQNLESAEIKRQIGLLKLKKSVWITLPLLVVGGLYLMMNTEKRWAFIIVLVYFLIYLFGLIWVSGSAKHDYKRNFLVPVLHELFSGIKYDPMEFMTMKQFDESGIFPEHYDSFIGDDHFSGTLGRYKFSFSDLEVSRKVQKGSHWDYNNTVFNGIFMLAVGQATNTLPWIVKPKRLDSHPTSKLVHLIRKFESKPTLYPVPVIYQPFEDQFRLYSPESSSPIPRLSVDQMDALINLQNELNRLADHHREFTARVNERQSQSKAEIFMSAYDQKIVLALANVKLFEWPFDQDIRQTEEPFKFSVQLISTVLTFIETWDKL